MQHLQIHKRAAPSSALWNLLYDSLIIGFINAYTLIRNMLSKESRVKVTKVVISTFTEQNLHPTETMRWLRHSCAKVERAVDVRGPLHEFFRLHDEGHK